MKNLKVSSLSKHKIKHIYLKKVTKRNYIVSAVVFVFLIASCCMIKFVDVLKGYDQLCSQIYSPVNPLFNDNGGIIFTNKTLENINKNNLKFITPIKCSEIKNVGGELHYLIDSSIMIISPEDGIIKEIGVLPNGEKYIEIAHSKNVVTRIENIYITGVINGQVVAKGKDIATSQIGETVRFSIYEDGIKQPNITLNKNQIIWESFQ